MTDNPAPSTPNTPPTPEATPGPDPIPTAGEAPDADTSPTPGADPGPDTTPTAAAAPDTDLGPTAGAEPAPDPSPTADGGHLHPDANPTAGVDRGPAANPTASVGPIPPGATDPGPDLSRLRWSTPEPGRLLGRGHTAGDFLEAYEWRVLERRPGYLRVEAGLPAHVRNPRGQLFGGFTPTYVDLVALFTVRVGTDDADGMPRSWLATTQMRLDYFEPITGPRFVIESELEKKRGRTNFVITRFFQDEALAVLAATTIREVPMDRPLGDA